MEEGQESFEDIHPQAEGESGNAEAVDAGHEKGKEEETETLFGDLFSPDEKKWEIDQDVNEDTEEQKKRKQNEIDLPKCADIRSQAKENFAVENINYIETLRKLIKEEREWKKELTAKLPSAPTTRNNEQQTEEQKKREQQEIDLQEFTDIHSLPKDEFETGGVENIYTEEQKKREQPEIDLPDFAGIHYPAKEEFETGDVENIYDIEFLKKLLIEERKKNKELTYELLSELETRNTKLQKDLDELQMKHDQMTQATERYEYISKFLQKAPIVLEVQNQLPALPGPLKECFKKMIGTTPTEEGDSQNQSDRKSAQVVLKHGNNELFEESVDIMTLKDMKEKPEYEEKFRLKLIEIDAKDKNHLHCEEYLLKHRKLLDEIRKHPHPEELELFLFTTLSPCTDRQPRSPKQAKNCHTIISEKREVLNVKTYVCFDVYYADGFDFLQKKYDEYLSPILGRSGKKRGWEHIRQFWTDDGLEHVQSVLAEFLPRVPSDGAFYQMFSKLKFESVLSELEKTWILQSWKQAVDEHCVKEKSCIDTFPAFEANLAKLSECCKSFSELALKKIDKSMPTTLQGTEDTENKKVELPQNLRETLLEIQNNVSQESKLSGVFAKLFNENVQNCIKDTEQLSMDTVCKHLRERYTVRLIDPNIVHKLLGELIPSIRLAINEIANERLTLHMIDYTVGNMERFPTKLLTFYKYS